MKSLYWYATRMDKPPDADDFAHQTIPINYWLDHPNQRSLCLAMEMGTGKSRIMARIADSFVGEYVIYMSPKSLKQVFFNELSEAGYNPDRKSKDGIERYHHISANAGNVYEQWNNVLETIDVDINQLLKQEGYDPKILIIMDEAHQLSQRIGHVLNMIHYNTRYSPDNDPRDKGINKLYMELRDIKHVKILTATGTIIPNEPFDVVPLLNIMRGRIYDGDQYSYAFPDTYAKFYFSFVSGIDKIDDRMDHLFISRIQHLIYWFTIPRGIPNIPIPEILPPKVERMKMGAYQWKNYVEVNAEEELLEKKMRLSFPSEGNPMIQDAGVFKSFTRQACNFAYPEDIMLKTHKKKELSKIALSPDEIFMGKELMKHSIKVYTILDRIIKQNDRIHGVFSHFVNDYGLAIFEKALTLLGWKPLEKDPIDNIEELLALYKHDKAPRFASLTGKQDISIKEKTLRIMNTKLNATDRLVRVVLYSGAAAHGITIYSMEVVHELEPNWTIAEMEQARRRPARIMSAQYLPPNRRVLTIYSYLAVPPEGVTVVTTDEHIHKTAINKKKKSLEIEEWISSACIVCPQMHKEEIVLQQTFIKAKKTPPMRMHLQCRTCDSELVPNLILQAGLGMNCKDILAVKPKKGVKFDRYILDPSTGAAWDEDGLIKDTLMLRVIWDMYLKK